jgi:predicted secreted protein
MRHFTDPDQEIQVGVGEVFAVALAGNPTTGYLWQASVDADLVELVDQEFERHGQGVGAGGREVFHFRTRGAGRCRIHFEQRRPWAGEPRDTKLFQVVIG